MPFQKFKHLFTRVHETTKAQSLEQRKHIAVLVKRLIVGIVVLLDKRLADILRGIHH